MKLSVLLAAACACLGLSGCAEEPVKHGHPPDRPARSPEQRRAHPIATPGPIGKLGGSSFFMDLQKDRPDADVKRPVLVEEDAKRREVGHAYLPAPVVRGFVDEDVVVVASSDEVFCYDTRTHEIRWSSSFAETGRGVDDLVRRGSKLDVALEGGSTVTLDLATGRR